MAAVTAVVWLGKKAWEAYNKKAVEAKFSENQALPVFKVPLF